jgi:hypothetical protein
MHPTRAAIGALDFSLRLAFFLVAPFCLAFVAALFPISGALAQLGLALVGFLASELVRDVAVRSRAARWLFSSSLQFEAYYRAHPPRPFLYYVFYPFLFPYWLAVPEARREFLLYKGYTLASFALLVVSLGVSYVRAFPPELGLEDFAPIALGTLAAETVAVLVLLMPLMTTVVHYHSRRAPRRLATLLVAGMLSVGTAGYLLERPRDPVVSLATRARVRLRAKARPSSVYRAHMHALRDAWQALPNPDSDVDTDGKVQGLALEQAHTALESFYRTDEAHSFDLWLSRRSKHAVLVLYFESRGKKGPIWLALETGGKIIQDPKKLPRGAFVAMKHAADAVE